VGIVSWCSLFFEYIWVEDYSFLSFVVSAGTAAGKQYITKEVAFYERINQKIDQMGTYRLPDV
jgi:hypothetical protein